MPRAFDGTAVPEFLDPLPCGGTPRWDYDSEMSYRCDTCYATIGSIGMPTECHDMIQDELERECVIRKMGFKDEEVD